MFLTGSQGDSKMKEHPGVRPLEPATYRSTSATAFSIETQLTSDADSNPLPWYSHWLNEQFKNLSPSLSEKLRSPPEIWLALTKFSMTERSIDDMARHLLELDLIDTKGDEVEGHQVATSVAFAVLGWQTMLYLPSFGTCPPQQLAIADVLDGYTGQAYMTLKQDQSRVKSPLADFLLGFGLMLPPENLCISDDPEDCLAFEKVAIIGPEDLNAALLKSLARINIQWVDTLAPHLEFDKATNTLYLFRYPSFCLANLPMDAETTTENKLFSCATQTDGPIQWASQADITQFLHEILLSYRLLFGQSKKARQLFRSMSVFSLQTPQTHDPLLVQLCCGKTSGLPIQERDFYRLRRDFPILRSRLATLQYQMTNLKPRGWREIWNDKRDSAQWLTFWAVIFIGGSGVLLALIQMVLQAAQLAGA